MYKLVKKENKIILLNSAKNNEDKMFPFDYVFSPDTL